MAERRKMSDEDFKNKIKEKFNGNIECIDTYISIRKTPYLRFKCNNPLHNEIFTLSSQQILRTTGKGCPFCNNQSKTELMIKNEICNKFKGNIEFADTWVYGKNNTFETFTFKCKKHGEFQEVLNNMLNIYDIGCKECANEYRRKKEIEELTKRLNEKLKGTNLIVDNNTIVGVNSKATFTCIKHNYTFERTVGKVLYSNRFKCDKCIESNGEIFIKQILNDLGFNEDDGTLICQENVVGTNLRYDFFIPEYNIAIEVDGKQHYDENSYYYSEVQVERDLLKESISLEENISLIRFRTAHPDRLNSIYEEIKKEFDEAINKLKSSTTINNVLIIEKFKH